MSDSESTRPAVQMLSVRSDYHWAPIPGVVRGEYVKIIIDRQNAAAGADGASF